MAQVSVTVHERPYQVMCEDGQEEHVKRLAAYIDQRVREIAGKSGVPGTAGQVTESRLLIMAALMVADELGEAYDDLEEMRRAPPRTVPDPATVKAAEEARSAASAARAQLAEAEAALRTANLRQAEAEAARNASDADAERDRAALAATEQRAAAAEQRAAAGEEGARAAEARAREAGDAARNAHAAATQAEAALQAAARRIAESELLLQEAERERAATRATLASLSAQSASARNADDVLASGLEALAQQIDEMATRVERGAARQ